jgi:hypothetical protein
MDHPRSEGAHMVEISQPDSQDIRDRADAILGGITDGTLLVLKGHLLLEETLYQAVWAKCPNPQYLNRAQLRFPQLLNLARALYPNPPDDEKRRLPRSVLWDAMEALNTLRNELSHKLEPKDPTPLLKRLKVGDFDQPVSLSDSKVLSGLAISIAVLLGTPRVSDKQFMFTRVIVSEGGP